MGEMARGRVLPELMADVANAGVEAGDCLLVHSSFKALGVPGASPADVIATLMAVLGSAGTIVMPTYTYSFTGIFGVQPYQPCLTPGLANGILTETLRRYPGAMRSGHPTFSVAALGKEAEYLTAGREEASAMGMGSSFDVAYQLGAKVLLLGVGNNRNSMLHHAEARARLPYNEVPFRAFWGMTALVKRGNDVVELPVRGELCGCSLNFGVADAFLAERGISRASTIGQAPSLLMSAVAMVDAVVERLRYNPAWLLCDSFVCEPCNRRKALLHERGMI